MQTHTTREEIVQYVATRSENTKKYFQVLHLTTSDVCHGFLKKDFLELCLKDGGFNETSSVSDLVEIAQKRAQDRNQKEEEKNSFLWGIKKGFGKLGLSIILGIDMTNMPVIEKEELGEAMLLAGLYFNAKS